MNNKNYLILICILIPIAITMIVSKEKNSNEELNQSDNKIYVNLKLDNNKIINLELEEYIIGVVGAEMPASFNIEALKAQSVASRTFTLYVLQNRDYLTKNDQAYYTNEELKEKWSNNYLEYLTKVKEAVNNTSNEVLTYDGKIIKSYYYSMSNGKTEDSKIVFNESLPYLKVIDSDYDNDSLNKFEYTTSLDKQDFCQKLNISCNNILIDYVNYDESDRVLKISINNQEFTGIEIRKILNLRSTDFKIIETNNKINIVTKGYGHGVGMSQYGANGMANSNYSYQEILKYYYQGTELHKF